MSDILSDLQNAYNTYCARRDAAQAKIDVLEDLKDTLSEYKWQIETSTISFEQVSSGYTYFNSSEGYAIGEIQYDCWCYSEDSSYTKLRAYIDSLDGAIDQINLDLADLRSEKLINIGLVDDALSAIDRYWTEHVTNQHN